MVRARTVYYVAIASAAIMVLAAAIVIITSPGQIDDVGAIRSPEPTSGDPVVIEVTDGEGVDGIANALELRGVIDSAVQFRVLVSLMGYDRLLQAGEYEFQPGTPAMEVVYRMRGGLVSTKSVTVIEGWQLDDRGCCRGAGHPRTVHAAASHTDYDSFSPACHPTLPEGYSTRQPTIRLERLPERRPEDARRVRPKRAADR
jgi:cell division protein YceG involved in septum cleavage